MTNQVRVGIMLHKFCHEIVHEDGAQGTPRCDDAEDRTRGPPGHDVHRQRADVHESAR